MDVGQSVRSYEWDVIHFKSEVEDIKPTSRGGISGSVSISAASAAASNFSQSSLLLLLFADTCLIHDKG